MKRAITFYALLTVASRGLQFLMLPLLTKLLTPEDYGFIELVATLTGLLAVLMSLSLESAAARMWHESEAKGRTAQLLSSSVLFVVFFGTLLFLVFWFTSDTIASLLGDKPELAPCVVAAVGTALALSVSSVPQIVLRMERKIFKFGVLQVTQSALGVALPLALMVNAGLGLYGFFLGMLLAAVATLGLSLVWVRQHLTWAVSVQQLRECLAYSLPLTPAVVINWANRQVDRIILLSLLGVGVVGIYGAAAKIAMAATVLVEVFRLAWLPEAMRKLDQAPASEKFFRRGLTSYLAVMCSIGLLLVAYSRELLVALTTGDYAPGYVVIPWLIGAQILYGSANITNVGTLASKKTGGNSVAALIGAVTNIGLGLPLVSAFGMWGAAIGSFVAALIFTTSLTVLSARQAKIHFDVAVALGIVLIFVLTSAGMLGLYYVSRDSTILSRTGLVAASLMGVFLVSAKTFRQDSMRSSLSFRGAADTRRS